jgi:hypothetical protein
MINGSWAAARLQRAGVATVAAAEPMNVRRDIDKFMFSLLLYCFVDTRMHSAGLYGCRRVPARDAGSGFVKG